MDELSSWVTALCACAAAVSAAEYLMPEGAVKKTAYFVLSLVAASCLLAPIRALGELRLDMPEIDESSAAAAYTDWLSRETSEEFANNTAALIEDVLAQLGIKAKNISVQTDIDSDGSVYINKARITADKRYEPRMDEMEREIYSRLGIIADIIIK